MYVADGQVLAENTEEMNSAERQRDVPKRGTQRSEGSLGVAGGMERRSGPSVWCG